MNMLSWFTIRPIFSAGILSVIGTLLGFSLSLFHIVLGFIVLYLVTLFFIYLLNGAVTRTAFILPLCLLFFALYSCYFNAQNISVIPKEDEGAEISLEGVIVSPITLDGNRVAFRMSAEQVYGVKSQEIFLIELRLEEESELKIVNAWQRGDRVRLTGNLEQPSSGRNFGDFNYRQFLLRQHIHWVVDIRGLSPIQVTEPEQFGWHHIGRWNDSLRGKLSDVIKQVHGPPHYGFVQSLVIGMKDRLDPELFESFSELGLTHILAISGLHVAVFTGGLFMVFRLLRLTKERSLVLAMVAIPFYMLLSGGTPSVVRAGIMALIGMYAHKKQLLKDGLHIVSIACMLMLLLNPFYIYNVSFHLSFIVTTGLIVGVPLMVKLLPIRYKAFKNALAVTLTAQWVSFPFSIYYFNQFSVWSWIANLVLVPFISLIILPLGMATLLTALLSRTLAGWLAYVNDWCIQIVIYAVEQIQQWDKYVMIWPTPAPMWMVTYYLLIIGSLLGLNVVRQHSSFHWHVKLCALFTACILVAVIIVGLNPDGWSRKGIVQFIDIGQGDAALIRTPYDRYILVDGGGSTSFYKQEDVWKQRFNPFEVGEKVLLPLLKRRGVGELEYVIISHFDTDHIGGLIEVIENIPVGSILMNGTYKDNTTVDRLYELALERSIPIYTLKQGTHLSIDKETKLTVISKQVTAKQEQRELREVASQNEQSLVVLLELYDRKLLFTGDIGIGTEQALLGSLASQWVQAHGTDKHAVKPSVDIMKVAHHGSKHSTSTPWLDYWSPSIAVISAGANNRYGHPHPDVISRLEQAKAEVWRTDKHGEIQIEITPSTMYIRSKLQPSLD